MVVEIVMKVPFKIFMCVHVLTKILAVRSFIAQVDEGFGKVLLVHDGSKAVRSLGQDVVKYM